MNQERGAAPVAARNETSRNLKTTEATDEQQQLLERTVINGMRVITAEGSLVESIMEAAESTGEGLANSITYVMQAVVGGMQKKGVGVPMDLIMSENGVASQITQLLVQLIGASGKDITPNEIAKALDIGLSNFGQKQSKGAQSMAAQQPGPEMPGQGQAAAPQGLLAGGA